MREARSIRRRPKRSSASSAGIEGLGQIIVGADLQPDDPVGFLAARRQHEDRNLRARADLAADFEPVAIGQHHVEDDRVERFALDRRQALAAGEAAIDDETGRGQIVRHHGGQPCIVVDDEKPLRHEP
jgi:hypothetical protein